MRTLQYQVLFTEGSGYVLASVADLRCEAVGATRAAALARVERLAARALLQYQDADVSPPWPARLSLGRIELPAPTRRRPRRRLRLVESIAERRPERRDRPAEVSRH